MTKHTARTSASTSGGNPDSCSRWASDKNLSAIPADATTTPTMLLRTVVLVSVPLIPLPA
jgi:hypothetical protein